MESLRSPDPKELTFYNGGAEKSFEEWLASSAGQSEIWLKERKMCKIKKMTQEFNTAKESWACVGNPEVSKNTILKYKVKFPPKI